jgi:hypothetical protein
MCALIGAEKGVRGGRYTLLGAVAGVRLWARRRVHAHWRSGGHSLRSAAERRLACEFVTAEDGSGGGP